MNKNGWLCPSPQTSLVNIESQPAPIVYFIAASYILHQIMAKCGQYRATKDKSWDGMRWVCNTFLHLCHGVHGKIIHSPNHSAVIVSTLPSPVLWFASPLLAGFAQKTAHLVAKKSIVGKHWLLEDFEATSTRGWKTQHVAPNNFSRESDGGSPMRSVAPWLLTIKYPLAIEHSHGKSPFLIGKPSIYHL